MQKLLLTGGSGFLGRAIQKNIKNKKKYSVKAPSKEAADLTNIAQAIKVCRGVEVVIHAAGLVLSRVEQQKRPAEVLFQNLSAALNIAEAARLSKVKKLIFISSITAYSSSVASPLKESDFWKDTLLGANFYYGLGKRTQDAIAGAYQIQYGLQTSSVIFSNLYGPADKFNFNPPPLVASAISQIYKAKVQGQKVLIAGDNGNQQIDLLYIEDAAEAVGKIVKMQKTPKLINIGSGRSVKISEIFRYVANALNYKGKIVWKNAIKNPKARYLDVSLMKKELRWLPKTSLETGIKKSVDWYLKNY